MAEISFGNGNWGPLQVDAADVVDGLVRINVAAAAVILLVLALRPLVRRWMGAETAYRLWLAPALAAFVAWLSPLLPARTAEVAAASAPTPHTGLLLAAWAVGLCAVFAWMARAQTGFERDVRRGRSGPAVVGVISPRVVLPADDGHYTDEERALIRAHERTHIERGDPAAAAVLAAFQVMFWFNPLVHVAARFMRMDQELACDAAVLRRRPSAKAAYARALLKTHLAVGAPPLGCYWGSHPLEVRVAALKTVRHEHLAAQALVTAGVMGIAAAVWAAQPPAQPHRPYVSSLEIADTQPAMNVMLIGY